MKVSVNHVIQRLHVEDLPQIATAKQSPSGRQALPLCGQLKSTPQRPGGTEYHSGVSTPFQEELKQVCVHHSYQYPVGLREDLALPVSKGAITRLEPTT